jgi:hypothetical protein
MNLILDFTLSQKTISFNSLPSRIGWGIKTFKTVFRNANLTTIKPANQINGLNFSS